MSAQIVRDIATDAFTGAIDILGIVENISALGLDQEARLQKFQQAGQWRAADLIWRALFSRLVILIARHYAPIRQGDQHAEKAFELLKDTAIAAQMSDPSDIAEAQRLWGECRDDDRLKRVITLRHKTLAHLGEWPSGVDRPLIHDAIAVARATSSALEKLARGTGIGLTLDAQVSVHKQSAKRFFAHWGDAE